MLESPPRVLSIWSSGTERTFRESLKLFRAMFEVIRVQVCLLIESLF